MTEKVSVADYRIQLNPEGSSNVVHVDQLWLDPCHQDRTNWVRNELFLLKDVNNMVDKGTLHSPTETVMMDISISCQTNDIESIIAKSNKNTARITVCRIWRRKGKHVRLVYYLQNDKLEVTVISGGLIIGICKDHTRQFGIF